MTQPQKASRKDIVLIIIGAVLALALMADPVIFLVYGISESMHGDEPWAMLVVFEVFPGILLSGFIGLTAALISLSLKLPRLPLKWFLLGFDVTGLGYAVGYLHPGFSQDSLGDLENILPIAFALAAGIVVLTVLVLVKSRLLAQNPPVE
jgi:hypothetical protein